MGEFSGRLAGKVALVIGASGGIGEAVARRFAAEGATVIATGTRGGERMLAASDPERIEALSCDVGDFCSVEGVVAHVLGRHGRIDVVVNNAGIGLPRKRLHEIEIDEWRKLMRVNLDGAFYVIKAVVPAMMAAGGGSLVTIASIASYRATALAGPYTASKGGVLQLTRAAALEYVSDNIRINAVCPGTVRTPMLNRHPPDFIAHLTARIPRGRLAEPEEVASLTLFLASDEAAYITGQGYVLDGGRSAGG